MNFFTRLKNKKSLIKLLITIVILLIIIFLVIRLFVTKKTGEETASNLPPVQFNVDEDEAAALAMAEVTNEIVAESKVVAVGADLISKEGKVISSMGTEVRSDVSYDSPEAPRQTLAMDPEELSEEIIKLSIGPDGFVPNEFKVKAGSAVSLALSGLDDSPHVLAFKSDNLKAVYINLNEGETKTIVFQAPSEKGRYDFYCDFPGHRSRGEEGVMIVE